MGQQLGCAPLECMGGGGGLGISSGQWTRLSPTKQQELLFPNIHPAPSAVPYTVVSAGKISKRIFLDSFLFRISLQKYESMCFALQARAEETRFSYKGTGKFLGKQLEMLILLFVSWALASEVFEISIKPRIISVTERASVI